ncbi:MAG: hypothetical protein K0Q73_8724 [Paenibacillus sp.]|nr:hypothetical protein [Paenibacillus sp.]
MKELNWDIVSLPTIKGQPAVGSQSYPSYYGITKRAQNKDASAQVLKYLVYCNDPTPCVLPQTREKLFLF